MSRAFQTEVPNFFFAERRSIANLLLHQHHTASRIGDRKGTKSKLCDKDFAERSGELSGAIRLNTLVLLGSNPVTPPNCSEHSLVLLVRFSGFVSPFWFLTEATTQVPQVPKPIRQGRPRELSSAHTSYRRPLNLETGIGGGKSPKIRGGVKILNFGGSLNLALFYRDSTENPQFGGQTSKLSKDNFRGEFPPPLAFGTFWPPLSRSPINSRNKSVR